MFPEATVILLFFLSVNGQGDSRNMSTTIGYDAEELLSKIFSGNVTQPRRVIKFEDNFDSNYVSFDDQNLELPNARPFKFELDNEPNNPNTDFNEDTGPTKVKFDNFSQNAPETGLNNNANRVQPNNGKKKRRRRKPRQQRPGQPGFSNLGHPNRPFPGQNLGPVPGPGQNFGPALGLDQNFGLAPRPGQNFGPAPGPGQYFGLAPGPGQNFGLAPGTGQNFGLAPGPGQNFGLAPGPGQNFGPVQGSGQNFGPAQKPGQNFATNGFRPEFNGQFYRPPRRPQPSLASDALTAVTGALTSIAHNDDYQCVARLLCEAAAGGALGGSSLLESISGLQPLLTLLSAYNGISSNPLFVFGRAAFLGMSSKSNPGSCRYAYPLCPTDPEELVHYLNNHNGGFFRFFNAPQQGPQNLEQFYNQLSQNYGLYQPSPGQNQEFYGLINPGQYQNPTGPPNLYPNGHGYQQNYGFAYPHNQNYNGDRVRFKNGQEINNDISTRTTDQNKINRRIQNKPTSFVNDNSVTSNSKWLFPNEDDYGWMDEAEAGVQYINDDDFGFTDNRKGKKLKFPDDETNYNFYNNDNIRESYRKPTNYYTTETKRTPKGISFPESKRDINDYNTSIYYNPRYSLFNNINKGVNEMFKESNYNQNKYQEQDEPGVTTVYVVRGNGDPNKPEIIKLRAGETL